MATVPPSQAGEYVGTMWNCFTCTCASYACIAPGSAAYARPVDWCSKGVGRRVVLLPLCSRLVRLHRAERRHAGATRRLVLDGSKHVTRPRPRARARTGSGRCGFAPTRGDALEEKVRLLRLPG
jgi:hypothetical protein